MTQDCFDTLDATHFLSHYWQKKPLLIPNGVAAQALTVSPDALAGLALEEGVDSRIVSSQDGIWQQSRGPFDATHFQVPGPWTLLVQGVDRLIPEVAALRAYVGFLPAWRFDDIMVSFATDGGSVGPHYDRYDVFLVQGKGCRRWKLGPTCDNATPTITHGELSLLADFPVQEEYLLNTGDVLYVPPHVAHWGTAEGESMTYSIGFRAPRIADLVARLADQTLDSVDSELLLTDAGAITPSQSAGEIRPEDLENVRRAVFNTLEALDSENWFGELLSEQGEPVSPILHRAELVAIAPCAKVFWRRDINGCHVFANGAVSPPFETAIIPTLIALCGGEAVAVVQPRADSLLLDFLDEAGALYDPMDID